MLCPKGNGNYHEGTKVSVFSFLKDEKIKTKMDAHH